MTDLEQLRQQLRLNRYELLTAYREFYEDMAMVESAIPTIREHPEYVEMTREVEAKVLGVLDQAATLEAVLEGD